MKTFLVIITALICTVGALLHNTNPKILKWFWQEPIPTFHLATRLPHSVILERDLPRFFRYYSIATPENAVAREAVQKVVRSRKQLRKQAGRIKTSVKAWDDSNVDYLLRLGSCGHDFEVAYLGASQQKKDNLLMWCLIASRITEGFFMESVEMVDSPLFLTRKKGIVIRRQPPGGIAYGYGLLSTSLYLHPRFENNTEIDRLPFRILSMLVSSSDDKTDEDFQEMIQRMLYELVVTGGIDNEFMILDEICQENQPERTIAFDAKIDNDGCFLVVPKKYGGIFYQNEDE